jgi:zinc/manganese transport system substrate-binding protein
MVHTRFSAGVIFLSMCLVPVASQAALNVFACEPEWAALAQELGGERLNIYSATSQKPDELIY